MDEILKRARKTRDGLLQIISEIASPEKKVKLSTNLRTGLDCEDFELYGVLRGIEIKYHIKFEDRVFDTFETVKDVFRYLIDPMSYLKYISRRKYEPR